MWKVCTLYNQDLLQVLVTGWTNFAFLCLIFVQPGFSSTGLGLPAKVSNIKIILNGGEKVTFLRPDGYFSLYPTILVILLSVHGSYYMSVWHALINFLEKMTCIILTSCKQSLELSHLLSRAKLNFLQVGTAQ